MDQQHISLSRGNIKMGTVPSISLPAQTTCPRCPCWDKCYAKKLERFRPSVRKAYQRNLDILNTDPDQYWREVEAAVMCSRFFRFHVSGDIPDKQYLIRMIQVARRNQHCSILCFTKRYEMVNEAIDEGFVLPGNLHMVFSAWRGFPIANPHNLPEAHVRYKDGTTTADEHAKECGGNCAKCFLTDCGCWTLRNGEQVVFNEH